MYNKIKEFLKNEYSFFLLILGVLLFIYLLYQAILLFHTDVMADPKQKQKITIEKLMSKNIPIRYQHKKYERIIEVFCINEYLWVSMDTGSGTNLVQAYERANCCDSVPQRCK